MFGLIPKSMWSKWIEPDADNRIGLAMNCVLLERTTNSGVVERILVESGAGSKWTAKEEAIYLFERNADGRVRTVEHALQEMGVDPASITHVILTHLHFDHAGGLLAPWQAGVPPKLLFPNAKFIVGHECWERAQNPHPRDRASFIPELPALLHASGRLEVIEGDQSPTLGPQVRFEYSHGHTPGLLLSTIGGEGGVTFCADLIPGRPWVHVPITMGYDRYPELLIDEKTRFLDDKLARGVRLFFTHDAECAMASVTRDAKQRYGVADEVTCLNGVVLT